MTTPKVHVLLASYNGANYIAEQLDSLMAQDYDNFEVYVFDDGSKDATVEIVRDYQNRYARIHLVEGERRGYPGSFFKLLQECSGADYYCFSDQDDVWLPHKISRAVEMLSQHENEKPLLYFARFAYHDGELNYMRDADLPPARIDFHKTFFQCYLWGFSVVINEEMRQLYVGDLPKRTKQKDYWIHLLCGAFGTFVYDEKICAKHRRHTSNHSQDPTSFIRFQIWRFKHFWVNNVFQESHDLLKEFYEHFAERLPEEKRRAIELFQSDGKRFAKIFYPKRLRSGMFDEILLRLMFLLGKL